MRSTDLGAVGADAIDVEVAEGLHVKDTVPIAVERHRLAVPFEVVPGRVEIVERGLGLGEAELHEVARGIVDVDQQCAARAAVLEPGVLAPVDLDELAATGPALARLVAQMTREPRPIPWTRGALI